LSEAAPFVALFPRRPQTKRREMLDLTINTKSLAPDTAVLGLEGEIDVYTSIQLKQEITQIISQGVTLLVLNMEKVEYLDSTGLGLLIGALKRLRENDGNLIIVSPSERIVRVFEITGLHKIFKIYSTLHEASEKENLEL
jgi:anti-sigma B factor antagonist